MKTPVDLRLPLRIRDRRESGDHQLQIVDQGAEGALHMIVIYTRFDDQAFAEFILRACNNYAPLLELAKQNASECGNCDYGNGATGKGLEGEPCEECHGIRAVIENAEGR